MGVEPYLVASTVEGIIAQRLVRLICPECREPYEDPVLAEKLGCPILPFGGAGAVQTATTAATGDGQAFLSFCLWTNKSGN